jgi:hypothetical protein
MERVSIAYFGPRYVLACFDEFIILGRKSLKGQRSSRVLYLLSGSSD